MSSSSHSGDDVRDSSSSEEDLTSSDSGSEFEVVEKQGHDVEPIRTAPKVGVLAQHGVLDSYLDSARAAIAAKRGKQIQVAEEEEELLLAHDSSNRQPLPRLNLGSSLPEAYFTYGDDSMPSLSEHISRATEKVGEAGPALLAPRETSTLVSSKKKRKEMKEKTSRGWFDLPTPADADRPRLYREVEALRLRNQLDPKRFYRKDESEGKGIKGLPKQFAVGTIVASDKPFGGPSEENLPKSMRKRTLVEELVEDSEARAYAKKKFRTLQGVRAQRGRGTYTKKFAGRKPKW